MGEITGDPILALFIYIFEIYFYLFYVIKRSSGGDFMYRKVK